MDRWFNSHSRFNNDEVGDNKQMKTCSLCGTTNNLAVKENDNIVYCGKCFLHNRQYPEIYKNNDVSSMTAGYKRWANRKNL